VKVSASQEGAARDRKRGVGTAALLSVALPGGLYWLIGHIAVHPSDEGFLWYGVLQTAAGEIPLRDFQSYDPGRYYWATASPRCASRRSSSRSSECSADCSQRAALRSIPRC